MPHLRPLALALSAALPLFAVAGRAQDAHVEDAFRRGATAMHNGRPQEAEAAFRDAVRLAPSMPEAHLDLGLVLARQGRLDDAIASVQHALSLNPALESANMFLGIFYHQTNRQAEAREALQKELTQHPGNAEALTWLGMVELADSHPEQAVVALDHAAALQPKDLNILELRGRAHNLVARDSYAQMARIDPNSWHVHRVRAQLFTDEGKHKEAIEEYLAAIKLEDRNPELFEELGDAYRASSQLDQARDAYAKELQLSPRNAIAMYDLGSTDIERGDNAAGVPLLREMLKSYAPAPVAQYYLGRGLAALGKEDEAVTWLEKSAAGDPSGEVGKRSWYELTRIYHKLQRPADAQRALTEYNRIRQADQARSDKQVEDWRKLNATTN